MSKYKETMSNVDTAWLHMDRPTNLMMIAGFMVLDNPLDFDRLLTTIERKLLVFDRFRQRVVAPRTPLGNYTWELDPYFDIRAHVHRAALPSPGDKAILQEIMSDVASTPLDRSRPLWQFQAFEGYDHGWVLACRLHHAIADGIALMRVLLSLTDLSPNAPLPAESTPEPRRGKRRSLVDTMLSPAAAIARTTAQVADTALHQSLETFRNPSRLIDAAKVGTVSAGTLAKMTLRSPDPQTIFKGDLGITKRTAWSDYFPLSDIKAVGKTLGGTINDIMMTAVTGALRRYMQDKNQSVDGVTIRAMVPVNLRPLGAPLELGNRFGLVFHTLPVGAADIHERYIETRRYMNEIKNSPEAVVAYGVLNALGMTPTDLEGLFLDFFGSKSSAVMTNVPGPQFQLFLAGSPLREIMAWVPQSGGLGMGVSVISYNGGIMVGVNTDSALVPDPELIVNHLYIEVEALKQLAEDVKNRASAND
jgi:diacylglycerol O-acyltransferase / wax synthase